MDLEVSMHNLSEPPSMATIEKHITKHTTKLTTMVGGHLVHVIPQHTEETHEN